MRSQYDAIFKSILTDPTSQFVTVLTNTAVVKSLPNDAGWYTGRTVDYLGEVNEELYVHLEIQAAKDDTMHWRMANYYTLLHHKLHRWERDSVRIKQFLVYIGPYENGMKAEHPHFGSPYEYETIDLKNESREKLRDSNCFGDQILSLLMSGVNDDEWKDTVKLACDLPSESRKMESLFFLLHLSNLRGKRQMVENALNEMGIYAALQSTPLTARATEIASINTVIDMLSDHYVDEKEPPISEEEREILSDLSLSDVKTIHKAITKQNAPRGYIMAAAVMKVGTSGPPI